MNFNVEFKKISLYPIMIILMLLCISLLEMYSLSAGQVTPRFINHVVHIFFGVCALVITFAIPTKFWKRYTYCIYSASLILLIAVSVFGKTVMGAKRWLTIGVITLQPSEMMRLALIMALSKYFSNITLPDVRCTRYIIGSLVLLSLPVIFVLKQPDLGSAVLLIFVYIAMLFIVGVQLWKFLIPFLGVLIATPFIWMSLHDYQKNRILMFLNPETDPNGAGYHIIQSKIALGAGGIFGLGFCNGTQCQLSFLPEKYTDFIFSAIGEEFGFIGCFTVVILYILLLGYNYKISLQTKDKFLKYLVFGINAMLFFYILINISMVCGIVPVVGVPLPFLSYGGTSLITLMFCEGLILSIANSSNN